MRLLLPPSESKNDGRLHSPLALNQLVFPQLNDSRVRVITAVQNISGRPKAARTALGISEKQDFERVRNLELLEAATSPAADVYCGVLFEALDLHTLTKAQRQRATHSVLIQSSLFGWLGLNDPIPAYRLSGHCTLPRLGVMSQWWKHRLHETLREPQVTVDLRSGTYSKFWQPESDQLAQTVTIKVMQLVNEGNNTRKIAVSHFNKATKGRVARDLLQSKATPTSVDQVAHILANAGWQVELHRANARTAPILEVMIDEFQK